MRGVCGARGKKVVSGTRSCISDRVTTDGTTLGLRSIFQWNFHSGVKIRREDDTEQIECLRHSKDAPWGAIVRFLKTAHLRCRLNESLPMWRLQFFIFAEHSYSLSFSILLAVQSRKWSIEEKRAETSRRHILIRQYYSAADEMWT